MKFKSADTLRTEVTEELKRLAKIKEEKIKEQVEKVFEKVEANKMNGKVTVQSISKDVKKVFENYGYVVEENAACHMGDVATTTIKW